MSVCDLSLVHFNHWLRCVAGEKKLLQKCSRFREPNASGVSAREAANHALILVFVFALRELFSKWIQQTALLVLRFARHARKQDHVVTHHVLKKLLTLPERVPPLLPLLRAKYFVRQKCRAFRMTFLFIHGHARALRNSCIYLLDAILEVVQSVRAPCLRRDETAANCLWSSRRVFQLASLGPDKCGSWPV